MKDEDDKLTPQEQREMRGPLYELAVAFHLLAKHDGLFKDCCEKICIQAIGALDVLDKSEDR